MSSALPIRRVVLYKHGVGYLERKGSVEGDASLQLDFKTRDMNDVLKSMTVLDLSGGTISAVSYDSTKPLEKLLEEATIRLPESDALQALLSQVKGARVRVRLASETVEGAIVGLDAIQIPGGGDASLERAHLTLLTGASIRTFDLLDVRELVFLDDAVKKDLEFYLSTVLSSYKKDSKRVTILTAGKGKREMFVSYVLETPVWKTSYRVLLDASGEPPLLQGWALVDNTGDEDWVGVELALIAGLPVSFVHDLYEPRYVRRPVVEVQREVSAAPIIPEESYGEVAMSMRDEEFEESRPSPPARSMAKRRSAPMSAPMAMAAAPPPSRRELMQQSQEVTTLTQDVGDLFEYRVSHPVTVMRNQSALVPILQRPFEGKRVLLFNRATRPKNPMACIEMVNTTGLTLEGGPVTITEGERYVGEAMLDTMKPKDRRLVPFAVELGCVISTDDVSEAGAVFQAVVANGVLSTQYFQFQNTHYRVKNKAGREQILLLEHPKQPGWELDDTAAPAEETDGFFRFRLTLAPEQELPFRVRMRSKASRTWRIDSASRDELKFFVASQYVDAKLGAAIEALITLRERVEQIAHDQNALELERKEIFTDQGRIRANLESLQKSGTKGLSDRLVSRLTEQEDRLEAIALKTQELEAQRKSLRQELTDRLRGLQSVRALGTEA